MDGIDVTTTMTILSEAERGDIGIFRQLSFTDESNSKAFSDLPVLPT
jgi:hypothetical protein